MTLVRFSHIGLNGVAAKRSSISTAIPKNLWVAAILMRTVGSCLAIGLNFPTASASPQNKIISGIKSVIRAIMQLVCNKMRRVTLKCNNTALLLILSLLIVLFLKDDLIECSCDTTLGITEVNLHYQHHNCTDCYATEYLHLHVNTWI